MLQTLSQDVQAVLERDPAARNAFEVMVCYPGLHAVWSHRIAHGLWQRGWKFLGRALSQLSRAITGIEIHPGATIGESFFIDHGMGVVIGETAEVGNHVTLYHGVTLGGTSINKGKRHPTLENDVVVGAGAKILGAITIGQNSRVGANAVVVKSAPPNSVIVGVPGEVIMRGSSNGATKQLRPDLQHDDLPDVIGETLVALMGRVETLERELEEHRNPAITPPYVHNDGVWRSEDYVL